MASRTRTQLESWIKGKTVFGKVLDVGGSQQAIVGRIGFDDGEVTILDLPNPHEEKHKADVEWDLNDQIDQGFERQDLFRTFDFATCLEVSEYWYDPLTALKNIALFLKPGGKLFISFHFTYPVHNPVEQDYLRYTRTGAVKLLERAGFQVADVVSRTGLEGSFRNFYISEGMRPAKGYEFHEEVGTLIEAVKR